MWVREAQRGPNHAPVWHWHYNRAAYALCGYMPPAAGTLTTEHVPPHDVNKNYKTCEKCWGVYNDPYPTR